MAPDVNDHTSRNFVSHPRCILEWVENCKIAIDGDRGQSEYRSDAKQRIRHAINLAPGVTKYPAIRYGGDQGERHSDDRQKQIGTSKVDNENIGDCLQSLVDVNCKQNQCIAPESDDYYRDHTRRLKRNGSDRTRIQGRDICGIVREFARSI